jgi:hypothetical protein
LSLRRTGGLPLNLLADPRLCRGAQLGDIWRIWIGGAVDADTIRGGCHPARPRQAVRTDATAEPDKGEPMASEEADSESAGDAGAAAAHVPLTHTTGGRPNRSAAYEPMHGAPAGLTIDGEFADAADRVAGHGAGAPQLPGLEMY